MPILIYNLFWMPFNAALALLAVLLAYFFLQTKSWPLKVIFGVLWLLFLPNTIYVITDLVHLIREWGLVGSGEKVLLVLQYIILVLIGLVTFILAYRPFEMMLHSYKLSKKKEVGFIIAFNFLIAFGMVLGRIDRINSWDFIISFDKVVLTVMNAVTSVPHIVLFVLLGSFCNFFYFLCRDSIYTSSMKLVERMMKEH